MAAGQPTTVTLSWNSSAQAQSYGGQLSTSSTFASTIFLNTGLTTFNTVAAGLVINTIYYWRVNASNAIGTSAWTASRRFNTNVVATLAPAVAIAPATLNFANGVLTY